MAVYTLLVDCGRRPGDGLPAGASGARLLCYVAAEDEEAAVRAVVAELKEAGLAPLDVEGFGPAEDREADGGLEAEEREMIALAEAEGAVVVGEVTPVFSAH